MKTIETNQTIHPDNVGIPHFCFLHFDFCTLNPLSCPACRLCSRLLCSCLLCSSPLPAPARGPLGLRRHDPIMQNKPNFPNNKITATSCATKAYANIPPRPNQKNKPNQTQFRPASVVRCRLSTHCFLCPRCSSRSRKSAEAEPPPQAGVRNFLLFLKIT